MSETPHRVRPIGWMRSVSVGEGMVMRSSVFAALVLAAVSARAQEPGARQDERAGAAPAPQAGVDRRAAQRTSDAFDRACVDLLQGRTPQDERAIRTLKDACGKLMAGRADDRIEAERRERAQLAAREELRRQPEGQAEPGRATGPVEPGQGVLAAFGQAASELTSRRRAMDMGMTRGGPIAFTLITNPVGWFNGLGFNAELFRVLQDIPKLSWVVGARYSNTDASNGNATTFGAMGGVDLFVVGRNNEGFRIGPRLEVAAGRERFQGSTTFARLGLSGEAGYNFVATNGITGLLAAGVGGRVAGDSQNDTFASFVGGEFGPYVKLGFGYSW